MNWDAIGAIGQMLGSIAVFVTLGYLAVQVRHARSETRRALSQGRGEALRDLFALQSEARMCGVYTKAQTTLNAPLTSAVSALMKEAGLTREEAFLVSSMQFAWWTYRIQVFPYVDELPPIERATFDRQTRAFYGTPGVARVFYEAIKPSVHPDASRYVDNLLARPG